MPPIPYGPNNPHPLSQLTTELVWECKYDEYGNRREVDAAGASMPLQKIETIDEPQSRALVQGRLFDSEKAHRDDFRNMLIWGDNKLVMASLLKDYKGKVDLIYIDPPFDVGADFTMDVPIGDEKETVAKDQSTLEMVAYRDMWGKGTDSYLHMMYERLTLMKELLSESGSIYIHCDWHVAHYLRAVLDDTFGTTNFRNEIIWQKTRVSKSQSSNFGNVHDTIFYYSKSEKPTFNPQYLEYPESYKKSHYGLAEEETGRRYGLWDFTQSGSGPARKFGDKVLEPPTGKHWIWSQERIDEAIRESRIVFTSSGMPRLKRYLDKAKGNFIEDIWTDVFDVNAVADERTGYDTQKSEALLERIIKASSNEGDLVADFFCGSGTTGAVAERLGRRWIMADLGRFAIHTTRKRMIELQRALHVEHQQYRSFDVYNLGRYERQWWQKERLKGADDEHRRIVLEFYRAEPLTQSPSPLLHGRKGQAFVHVDSIDGMFTRAEVTAVAKAAQEAGAKEVNCLAWEFEMDLRLKCMELEAELGIKIKLIPIPREIMEKNRKNPPPFLEVATLEAAPVYHHHPSPGRKGAGGEVAVEIKLVSFIPSLAEVPSKELEVLKERAIESGFDFIDFWAVDFDYHEGQPFNHHWQAYRTRKNRSLPIVSTQEYRYPKKGKYTACVKVVDVFGCDTSVTVEVKI